MSHRALSVQIDEDGGGTLDRYEVAQMAQKIGHT